MYQQYGGPKLPVKLRDQLGEFPSHERKHGTRDRLTTRKDKRKADRVEKRRPNRQQTDVSLRLHQNFKEFVEKHDSDNEEDIDWDKVEGDATPPPISLKNVRHEEIDTLKRKLLVDKHDPVPSAKISRAMKERLAEDDASIAALEKKLGMKKKRMKTTDGSLDDIMKDLGDFSDDEDLSVYTPSKNQAKDSDWLANKRKKASIVASDGSNETDADFDGLSSEGICTDEDRDLCEDDTHFDSDTNPDFRDEAFKPRSAGDLVKLNPNRTRENPYVAPTVSEQLPPTKYIPPALRVLVSSNDAVLLRLRRQLKGLFNRLSEANILTILRDVEGIYQSNARGYVNTTLVELLIDMLSDPSLLLDSFLNLHAGFIAAVYKVIGPDFGALLIECIVDEIDKYYLLNKAGTGKQTTNLVTLVADLYTFQVIGSNIVFDYIRFCLDELSEINTELLLRIVRTAGPQLRQDDPTALKDIVVLLQKAVNKIDPAELPVRTKFMIESITDLKNNRIKSGTTAIATAREHTTRMKKQLGTLNARNLKATEPLRVGLKDVKDTEKKGKWWLVGASWRKDIDSEAVKTQDEDRRSQGINADRGIDDGEVDLVQLARENRMNTDIRRAIFVSIMSASDFQDAQMRLSKLNLKKNQEFEIPRVIVHCASVEMAYNPYYTVLARKLCSSHKMRKSLQFTLWDIFKGLGEQQDEADDSEDEAQDHGKPSVRKLVNQGKLYGTLIGRRTLSITCLKNLNFPYLRPDTKMLVEILIITAILESLKVSRKKEGRDERAVREVFIEVDQAPEMIAGIQWFMKRVVKRTSLVEGNEKSIIEWACRSILDILSRVLATTTIQDS